MDDLTEERKGHAGARPTLRSGGTLCGPPGGARGPGLGMQRYSIRHKP